MEILNRLIDETGNKKINLLKNIFYYLDAGLFKKNPKIQIIKKELKNFIKDTTIKVFFFIFSL